MDKNPVLVYKKENGDSVIQMIDMNDKEIPDFLNGENGFHVYHVRIMSELMLRDLCFNSDKYDLDENKIRAMSIATSLHDIGKLKVPQSILDYPGRLSPLEYDIVKKHTIFGVELIEEAKTDVDPLIIEYAKEIALNHHERYDGTGYPRGLKGEQIPISAQVVSIVDAFDALTSSRSYKEALSQDVAIEMIANGQCGVFNEDLIESLLRVANHKDLKEIREKLKEKRTVIADPTVFTYKHVLLIGNTGYINQYFIDNTFYDSRVIVVGETHLPQMKNVKTYQKDSINLNDLFNTYEFDIVIYFSHELTYQSNQESDIQYIREVFSCAKESQKHTRFLYYSSLIATLNQKSDMSLLIESKEKMCQFYSHDDSLELKIVRIPFLYSSIKKDDFLYKLFDALTHHGKIEFSEGKNANTLFLSMYDLCELTVRLIDNWSSKQGILNLNDEFHITFLDLANKLKQYNPHITIHFDKEIQTTATTLNNKALRSEYGYFSKISIIEDLDEEYEKYLVDTNQKVTSFIKKIKNWLNEHALVMKITELLVLFVLTELLMAVTNSSVIFSIVDFRMIYIVIVATLHQLSFGIAAATLSSLSWLVAKVMSGTNLLTIFYEPTNWLAFVFFYLVAGMCGYTRMKSVDEIKTLKEENQLLENKLSFVRSIYTDTSNEKRDLKKQIIGSKDSFGKIYEATRNLDTVEPRELYLKIIDTFEDILDNKNISIYSVSENSAYARLEVASRDIMKQLPRSISLNNYQEIVDVTKKHEVWRNHDLKENLPMFASGIFKGEQLVMLVYIWSVSSSQRSLYYANLFKIMTDLAEMSLLRAYEYNQVMYDKQYVAHTHVLNKEAFKKMREYFKTMAERKISTYLELEITYENMDFDSACVQLAQLVRSNDILGMSENQTIHLLLSQATESDLPFILPRLEKSGFKATVLPNN